jgi:hypothetical protein
MQAWSSPTPSTMSETDNVMQLVKTMKNRAPTVQEKDELMMSLTDLFDDDFNAPFDSFMLTVEDMLEGREVSSEQDIDALCDKLNESSANFGDGEISRLFESFADLFQTERSCSAADCRKLKAKVDRIARMRRKMAQSEKYKPDFAGFPQSPHSGLAEKACEDDLMAIRRRTKLSKEMLRGPLQEWREEQLLPDDVEKRLRDKEYGEQMSGIASSEQGKSKRSQSKSRREFRAGSRGRSRSGSRGRSRSQSRHSRSRSRNRNEADHTPASPRVTKTREDQLAGENAETKNVVKTRRRGRSLSRGETDITTPVSPTERGIQQGADTATKHVSNTMRRGRSLSRREAVITEVSLPRQARMVGTEGEASPRRRGHSASRRREKINSMEKFPPTHMDRQRAMVENTEYLASPRRSRRSVLRQENDNIVVPAAASGNFTPSKSVSAKSLQLPQSKSSRSVESGEFSVISKGSTKEIRERVRSCSRGRSHSPGSRDNSKPACLSPRKGRRERVAMGPSVSLFSPKTQSRKLEPKLDQLKLKTSAPLLDDTTGSPGSPNCSVENSLRTNQTWDPSMGRTSAADLGSDLISSSQSVGESPRRRQQPVVLDLLQETVVNQYAKRVDADARAKL